MVEVTITIEYYSGDASCKCSLGSGFAYLESLLLLGASLEAEGRSVTESVASLVVDDLNVDLLVATEDAHAGTLSGSGDLIANAELDFRASCFFCFCHNLKRVALGGLLSASALTTLATDNFADVEDTLALVRFGLAE